MASGGKRILTGAIDGTGSALQVRTVGFRPSTVRLFNTGGLVTAEWSDTMPDDAAVKRVTAGDMTYIVEDGITPLSNGFTIGADTDINVDGEAIHWVASE
jgi:hypothetical protein